MSAEVKEMLHKPTIARCIHEIETGLDAQRWIDLWRSDGRELDTVIAIGFYHSALQDARQALAKLAAQ